MKYSKEGQDQFALICNPQRGPKFYLDLGSAHPEDGNNTVRLEELGWDGLRFDINPHVVNIPSKRSSHTIIGDVTRPGFLADRLAAFGTHKHINYISFDVDDGTLGAIAEFPWETYRFTCMTFEHDSYGRESEKDMAMFDILHPLGYSAIPDVCYEDEHGHLHIFEDWYYDPHKVPEMLLPKLHRIEAGLSWKEVIKHLST